jgi:hypothetical protein
MENEGASRKGRGIFNFSSLADWWFGAFRFCLVEERLLLEDKEGSCYVW